LNATYFHYRHYPARLPALRAGEDAARHRVAIVGGGPIGLALALGLARYGVPSVSWKPTTRCARAAGPRASPGAARDLRVAGLRSADACQGPGVDRGRSYYRDTEVFRPGDAARRAPAIPPMINLQQCFAEQYLVDATAQAGGLVDLRWQSKVAGVPAARRRGDAGGGDAGRRLPARCRLGGRVRPARAAWCARRWASSSKARSTRAATSSWTSSCAATTPPSAEPGRPAVQSGSNAAHAQAAGRHLAHRLSAPRRRGCRRGGEAAETCCPACEPSEDGFGASALTTGSRLIQHVTRRTRSRCGAIATLACCSPAMPRTWCRSSACAA